MSRAVSAESRSAVGLELAPSEDVCTTVRVVPPPAAPVPRSTAAVIPPPTIPAASIGRNPLFTTGQRRDGA